MEKGGRSTRPPLSFWSTENLLRHLTADFAARIGRGVNVDVVFAGHQVGRLFVGEDGAAFGGARGRIRDRNLDAGVLAGLGGSVEMGRGRGTREPRIGQLPGQLLGGRIIVDVGRACTGSGRGGHLRFAVERRLHLFGKGRACEGNGRSERKRSKHGPGHGSLPVDLSNVVSLTTARFRIYSRKRPQRRKIFGQTEARAGPALALNVTGHKHASYKPPGHDGSVNAATNSLGCRRGWRCGLWRLLVADRAADRVGGHGARLHAKPCERTGRLQCRGMFLLPRGAQPARSIKAGRRTCYPLAIWHLLRSEYFARP